MALATAAKRRYPTKPFNPYVQARKNNPFYATGGSGGAPSPTIPAGLYDPSLDYQQQAATRGVQDLSADTYRNFGIQGGKALPVGRAYNDYQLGLTQNSQDSQYAQDQLATAHNRAFVDVGTGLTRAKENHDTALANLARSYNILGQNQAQSANAAGLVQGGALAQAASKRAANQAIDQQPIDTSYSREVQNLETQGQRANEDYGTQSARDTLLSGRNVGQLGLSYQRQTQDANTALSRAQRENKFYGLGINQQRAFQAAQFGYTPPTPKRKRRR